MQHQVLPLSLRMTAFLLSGMSKPFPGLTARLFYRLYCTPPGTKARSSELRSTARLDQLTVTRYAFDKRPLKITTYRWGTSDKKILLLHGWGGSPFHFRQLIHTLVHQGYEVIAYDAPAHGESDGKRTNLVQWAHVLEQIIVQTGPLYAIIGHSLGGLNAALTLSRKTVQVPRLVMLSAALSAPVFFNEALQLFKIHPVVMPPLRQLIHQRLHENLEEMDLHLYINQIKAEKILMAYDTTDTLVDEKEITAYVQEYPAIRALRITGEGHFRIMRQEPVIKEVIQFLGNG
ncbi:alpha/beta hydrolase [Chitinophaga qingshengii]|uniref:Alpha/beta fold hydrolase n=1 Tax=Chitinophaga qingshengii TaxID=1569794 RepID=A0ABR7TMF6_9BACT|nr:alpha/beta fold hydrolase [Chitinophaga qingshengii]MBC9930249.1 alpha/beta fold hydrolase [Chitinophaga qingshengii]